MTSGVPAAGFPPVAVPAPPMRTSPPPPRVAAASAFRAAAPAGAAVEPLARAEEWNIATAQLFGRGKFTEALEACERALLIAPANETALNNRANRVFKLGRRAESL